MSVFDPECSRNRFSAEFKLTGDGGSPYEFGIRFSVDGDYFAVGGLSMGDMVRINREFRSFESRPKCLGSVARRWCWSCCRRCCWLVSACAWRPCNWAIG